MSIDLQARKLNMINYLINLNDEKAFSKIESVAKEVKKTAEVNFKLFTKSDLIKRAKKSSLDIANGKLATQKEVEKIAKNW